MRSLLDHAANAAKSAAIGSALGLLGLPAVRRRAIEPLKHAGMILMFHHVAPKRPERLPVNEALEVTPECLDHVLCSLKAQDYDIISMDAVPERLACARPGKRRFAALTFDDAGRDNLLHAAPVLLRHGAPFTIYVTTGFASGRLAPWWHVVEQAVLSAQSLAIETASGRQWFDTSNRWRKVIAASALIDLLWRASESTRAQQAASLAIQAGLDGAAMTRELFMDWSELSELAGLPGCAIGAHTTTHPKLAELDDQAAMQEISEARDILRDRLRVEVNHLAYPYGVAGTCEEREFTMARTAGFSTAVTTRRDVLTHADINGLTSLPRVQINGRYQQPLMIDAMVCGLPVVLAAKPRTVEAI